jgi:hypothetical protein
MKSQLMAPSRLSHGTLASRTQSLLDQTLNEEKEADGKLTQIGEPVLSPQAAKHTTASA